MKKLLLPPQKAIAANKHKGALLVRLWRDYLSVYKGRLFLALLAMAVFALANTAIPMIVEAINSAFIGASDSKVTTTSSSLSFITTTVPFLFPLVGALYGISQYTQSRLTLGAALDALRDIQNDMLAHYLAMDFETQRQYTSGALASHFTNDIQLIRETMTRSTNGVRDLMVLVSLCALLFYYDGVLFAAVIAVYGLLGWPIVWLGKKLRQTAGKAQNETGNLATQIIEISDGAAMIKSYHLENKEIERGRNQFQQRTNLLKRAAFVRAINEPFIFFVAAIATGVAVMIIGLRIQAGHIDAEQVAGFFVALLLLSQPARGLSTLYAVIQEGLAAFERVITIIDTPATIHDKPDATTLKVQNGMIEFNNVSFAYNNTSETLSDITFSAPAGKAIALVGESGAGKTSLIHLLSRLYDAKAGQISIDGQFIEEVTISSLRANIAVVSQDSVIFDDSLRANIAFGKLDASEEDIINAAKAAAIHDFILTLPDKYDTLAGEHGNRLSGGQRQRIAIARAFLKDAPILILDEPTAALDAASEAAIQTALKRLQQGRTTLIIAHRLSTIRDADKIIVMEKGRIIETGDHDSLMNSDRTYKRLINLQFGETSS